MSITIELDEKAEKWLAEVSARRGARPDVVIRDIVHEQLAVRRPHYLRERLGPKLESAGFRSDEDVFREIS